MYSEEKGKIGTWGFTGSSNWDMHGSDTYSCGIFQWIAGKNGPKASAVSFRVKGYTGDTTAADIAQRYCEVLNKHKFTPAEAFSKVFRGRRSAFYRKGDQPEHLDQLMAENPCFLWV